MRQYLPLRGVRVLAFEAAFSLPSGTRTLAELGADVVRVGRPARGTPRARYITVVDGGGLSKSSLSLNLGCEEGRDLARQLVARADVVCNNFRPRVMKRFGLDRDALWAIKPDLIILQLTGYGTPGPWQDFPAYGPSTEAAGGMNYLMGDEGDPPVRVGSGVFADQVGGRYAALALIAALVERRRTGRGRYIDLSMAEGITHLLGDAMLRAAATGRPPARHGNRDPHIAPQGIYPCRGTDEWIAISIVTPDQWRSLVDVIGDPALDREQYSTVAGRRREHDLIDARISAWTRGCTKHELAALLQERGIPAGPVQKTSDLPVDPHLIARGAFHPVRHRRPVLGYTAHPHLTTPWRATGHARAALRDYSGDGAENKPVLKRWLGLSARAVARMERAGVLQAAAWSPLPDLPAEPGVPVDPDFGARLGLPAEGA
jgi:crotonobetainyl-CoA:carnitine CoA-transferase CaiB-like acyl-CoA transferase